MHVNKDVLEKKRNVVDGLMITHLRINPTCDRLSLDSSGTIDGSFEMI
jgi:hypothetical protein